MKTVEITVNTAGPEGFERISLNADPAKDTFGSYAPDHTCRGWGCMREAPEDIKRRAVELRATLVAAGVL